MPGDADGVGDAVRWKDGPVFSERATLTLVGDLKLGRRTQKVWAACCESGGNLKRGRMEPGEGATAEIGVCYCKMTIWSGAEALSRKKSWMLWKQDCRPRAFGRGGQSGAESLRRAMRSTTTTTTTKEMRRRRPAAQACASRMWLETVASRSPTWSGDGPIYA